MSPNTDDDRPPNDYHLFLWPESSATKSIHMQVPKGVPCVKFVLSISKHICLPHTLEVKYRQGASLRENRMVFVLYFVLFFIQDGVQYGRHFDSTRPKSWHNLAPFFIAQMFNKQ